MSRAPGLALRPYQSKARTRAGCAGDKTLEQLRKELLGRDGEGFEGLFVLGDADELLGGDGDVEALLRH